MCVCVSRHESNYRLPTEKSRDLTNERIVEKEETIRSGELEGPKRRGTGEESLGWWETDPRRKNTYRNL